MAYQLLEPGKVCRHNIQMLGINRAMSKTYFLILILLSPVIAIGSEISDGDAPYETDSFRGDQNNNFVGTVYICAHLAETGHYAEDFPQLLEKFIGVSSMTPEESEALKRDAKRWWQQKPKNVDYTSFWNRMCQKPTENMRAYFSGNKNT